MTCARLYRPPTPPSMICLQGGSTQAETISVREIAVATLSMTSEVPTKQRLYLQDVLGNGKFVRAELGTTAVLITFEDVVEASELQETAGGDSGSSKHFVKVDWNSHAGEKEQKLKLRFQPGRSLKTAFLDAARRDRGQRMARFVQEELQDHGHKLKAVDAGCISLTFSSDDPDFRRKMRDPATLDKIKADFVQMFFPDLPQEELLSAMTLQPVPPAEDVESEDAEDTGFSDNFSDASSNKGEDGGETVPGSRLDMVGNGNIIQIGLVNSVILVKFTKEALEYMHTKKKIDCNVLMNLVEIHWKKSERETSSVTLKLKVKERVDDFVRTLVAKSRENLAEHLAAFVEQQHLELEAQLTAITTGCITLVFSGAATGFRAAMEENAERIKSDFVRLLAPGWDTRDVQVELLGDASGLTSPAGSEGQVTPEGATSDTRPRVRADTLAMASQKFWEEIRETLLTCKICEEPFDQKERLPQVLPCHHTFCGPCIAKLDKGGQLSCPDCRQNIQVAGTFPVEETLFALLDCTEVIETAQEALCEGCDDGTKATSRCLDCAQNFCERCCRDHQKVEATRDHALVSLEEAARSPSLLQQKVEMCQKHQDKKLEFYCKTCKSAICSSCIVVLHKDNVELGEVLEQAKRQIESHCRSLDNIRESSLQPRAKMAATSLQETDASFKAAEQEIEDVFAKAGNVLLDRKAQAVEELRSKWKEDRIALEDQAAATQSLVSSAKTSTALGRTVSSVGLPSHIVAQEQELERAVQEARAEGGKPLLSSVLYKLDTDLSGLVESPKNLGSSRSVTSRSTGVPTAATVTSSTILTPEFQLEPGRCRAKCTVWTDGKTLSNLRSPQSGGTAQPGLRPFAFLGTCGSVDLAQPALHYWTVKFKVQKQGSGDRCEFGLASRQTLDTCGEGQRISDHDTNSATVVVVREGNAVRVEGRNWTRDVDTPQSPQCSDVTYTCLWEREMERRKYLHLTLGFLYDNRQPQSPRVLVVDTESCRLLGVRRLSPSPDLRPVLRLWPAGDGSGYRDALLHVETGPAALKDTTAWQLHSLLERMDRKMKE